VTPIQMLMAYATLANGGMLLPPTLAISPVNPRPTGTRILPESLATAISKALLVKDPGLARVDGISVAGKSGTTPDGSEFVTSFVGFFPIEHPKVVGIVVVDKADVKNEINYGGLVAAPIFSKIAEKAAVYLHITEPAAKVSRTTTP